MKVSRNFTVCLVPVLFRIFASQVPLLLLLRDEVCFVSLAFKNLYRLNLSTFRKSFIPKKNTCLHSLRRCDIIPLLSRLATDQTNLLQDKLRITIRLVENTYVYHRDKSWPQTHDAILRPFQQYFSHIRTMEL